MACYKPNLLYFEKQLDSIQSQTMTNWTCICTFDSPLEDVLNQASMKRFLDDSRFIFARNPGLPGVLHNFKYSLAVALTRCPEADAFAFSDQDDIWYPNKLEKCLKILEQLPPMSCVHSDSDVLISGEEGDRVLTNTSSWQQEQRGVECTLGVDLLICNVGTGAAMLMDIELAKKYRDIPEDFPIHDWWFSYVAAAEGGLYPIHESLYAYRQHGTNVMGLSPYNGFFKKKAIDTSPSIRKKAKGLFIQARDRYQIFRRQGLPVGFLNHLAYAKWSLDFGLILFLMGAVSLLRSKPLARAYIARGVGKTLLCLNIN
jgi:hypothetical protein